MKWMQGLKDCFLKLVESLEKKKLWIEVKAKRIRVRKSDGGASHKQIKELKFKCIQDMKVNCLKVVCHRAQALPSDGSIAITTIFKGCELMNIDSIYY